MSFRSDRLREVRELRKLSQNDLAELMGTAQTQIYRYESGGVQPTSEMLVKIAQALNVTSDYLLGLEEVLSESNLSADELEVLTAIRQHRPMQAMGLIAAKFPDK